MMKLIADSSSDRPAIAGAEVQYVPLVVSTDHVHFVDDETLDVRQMLFQQPDSCGEIHCMTGRHLRKTVMAGGCSE